MMINLRYHIASLTAVLAALGIGILIGSLLINGNSLLSEQEQLVSRLEQDFQVLREQNRISQQEIAVFKNQSTNLEEFAQQVLPKLVDDKLKGTSITVICLNEGGIPPSLVDVLKIAGADINLSIVLNHDFDAKYTANKETFAEQLWPTTKGLTSKEMGRNLARVIADSANKSNEQGIIKQLEQMELLRIEGTPDPDSDGIIVVGGSCQLRTNRQTNLDLPLLRYLAQAGKQVVVVECSDVAQSSIKEYRTAVNTTIDNIDTVPGQMALILALQGQNGHYGCKSSADQLLPCLD